MKISKNYQTKIESIENEMSKELEALEILNRSACYDICYDAHEKQAYLILKEALIELKSVRFYYSVLQRRYNKFVAYAANIQKELNELKKSGQKLDT